MTQQPHRTGLPPAARARLAEIRASGTWGSALSTDEFAAIRSVGFEPVGQVLGAAVYNVGYAGSRYGCPSMGGYRGQGSYFGQGPYLTSATTAVTGDGGGFGGYGPLVRVYYDARRAAVSRMTEECRELGGHGVVGVSLTIRAFPAGGLEFHAIGTAVRAPGVPDLRGVRRAPFSSDLTGQDFAKLIMSGWVPAGLVFGISIGVRHDDWATRRATSWGAGNVEVPGYTDLINRTRHDARNQVQRDVSRLGGDGVVIRDMNLRMGERECGAQEGARDHLAEAVIIGTAITRFSSTHLERPRSLAILSLDPERRGAARRAR